MAFGKQNPAPSDDASDSAGDGKGQYDTATQTFRKPGAPGKKAPAKNMAKAGKPAAKKAGPPSKGGFSGKTSQVRALTPQEHQMAAETLNQAGQHLAAAHHRSSAEQMAGPGPQAGQ